MKPECDDGPMARAGAQVACLAPSSLIVKWKANVEVITLSNPSMGALVTRPQQHKTNQPMAKKVQMAIDISQTVS